jgi:basic membrane protein A and related proteins
MRTGALLLTAAALLAVAACGGAAPVTPAAGTSGPTVGIFVDDAFGDGDFMDQGGAAKAPLQSDLGATVTTYEGRLEAQNFEPLLQDAARANKLVFVLGFEAIDALTKVAKANPDTTFVFVDGVVDGGDVVSAQFRTAEGCYMAGALAAVTKQDGATPQAAGFIGGVDAPVVQRCRAGFEQGVHALEPAMAIREQFVGSFTDPAKGKEVALSLVDQGAYAVFSYAGLSGAGGFDAAKSGAPIAPIGVVADKSALAPGKVPGSLMMGVDSVILAMAQRFQQGTLAKGAAFDFGLSDGGWKMTYDPAFVDAATQARLDDLQAQIVSGGVEVADPGMS